MKKIIPSSNITAVKLHVSCGPHLFTFFSTQDHMTRFCFFPLKSRSIFRLIARLVPHVDKAPLPLRILRLVTSNFLPVENPTHPTAHAPERASVYILGQFCTLK